MGSSELLLQYLPTGFRFHPTDEELIAYYLVKKVLQPNLGGTVPITAQVDLNKCEPWDLPEKAKMGGKEKEWYFFSLRDRKYPTGLRTNRATEAGYWKATGKDREIYTRTSCCNLVVVAGMKKTLVFYRGRAPTGVKTNWVMHEYRLEPKFAYHHLPASKDEWVISRVFQKTGTTGGGKKKRTLMINLKASDTPASASAPATASSDHQSNLDNINGSSSNKNKCSKEHVPCFSTILSSTAGGGNVFMSPIDHNNNPFSYFPPPPPPRTMMDNNPLMILESLGRMPTFVSDNMNGGHYYEMNASCRDWGS